MSYARVLPDNRWWRNCKTNELVPFSRHQDPCFYERFRGDYAYPAPVPHFSKPAGGGTAVRITAAWWKFTKAINAPEAWKALRRNNGGWINYASNKDWPGGSTVPDAPERMPIIEGITSIENHVEVLAGKNNSKRIKTFLLSDKPPNPEKINPKTNPELFCHFTSINKEGLVGDAPDGVVSYFPLLARAEAWIPDEKLEMIAELPKESKEMSSNLPLWRDYSRHQGQIDFEVVKQNNIYAMIARAGVSWGYQDAWFPANWAGAQQIGIYRTSYHVIWTDQPIVAQADNWYKVHDERDILPRVIDLEVERGDTNEEKANAVLAMSDLVLKRDGVRPIIYSRYALINEWLASWSQELKHEHYYHLAQYLNDPKKEHAGPPTLPKGVNKGRVLLHQTADKLPGFPGEAQSAAVDYNRWQLGDKVQMHKFIADNWGGILPEPEPPEDLNPILDDIIAYVAGKKTQG